MTDKRANEDARLGARECFALRRLSAPSEWTRQRARRLLHAALLRHAALRAERSMANDRNHTLSAL
jgi:hypothetical protein